MSKRQSGSQLHDNNDGNNDDKFFDASSQQTTGNDIDDEFFDAPDSIGVAKTDHVPFDDLIHNLFDLKPEPRTDGERANSYWTTFGSFAGVGAKFFQAANAFSGAIRLNKIVEPLYSILVDNVVPKEYKEVLSNYMKTAGEVLSLDPRTVEKIVADGREITAIGTIVMQLAALSEDLKNIERTNGWTLEEIRKDVADTVRAECLKFNFNATKANQDFVQPMSAEEIKKKVDEALSNIKLTGDAAKDKQEVMRKQKLLIERFANNVGDFVQKEYFKDIEVLVGRLPDGMIKTIVPDLAGLEKKFLNFGVKTLGGAFSDDNGVENLKTIMSNFYSPDGDIGEVLRGVAELASREQVRDLFDKDLRDLLKDPENKKAIGTILDGLFNSMPDGPLAGMMAIALNAIEERPDIIPELLLESKNLYNIYSAYGNLQDLSAKLLDPDLPEEEKKKIISKQEVEVGVLVEYMSGVLPKFFEDIGKIMSEFTKDPELLKDLVTSYAPSLKDIDMESSKTIINNLPRILNDVFADDGAKEALKSMLLNFYSSPAAPDAKPLSVNDMNAFLKIGGIATEFLNNSQHLTPLLDIYSSYRNIATENQGKSVDSIVKNLQLMQKDFSKFMDENAEDLAKSVNNISAVAKIFASSRASGGDTSLENPLLELTKDVMLFGNRLTSETLNSKDVGAFMNSAMAFWQSDAQLESDDKHQQKTIDFVSSFVDLYQSSPKMQNIIDKEFPQLIEKHAEILAPMVDDCIKNTAIGKKFHLKAQEILQIMPDHIGEFSEIFAEYSKNGVSVKLLKTCLGLLADKKMLKLFGTALKRFVRGESKNTELKIPSAELGDISNTLKTCGFAKSFENGVNNIPGASQKGSNNQRKI